MGNGEGSAPDATRESEIRSRISAVLQFVGVFDILLGAVVAFWGPQYFEADSSLVLMLPVFGGFLALGGVGIWWYARFIYGKGH